MTGATLTLDQAQEALRRGVRYGEVYEVVPEADRAALAEWFCRTPGLPNLAARSARPVGEPTGDACSRCGGLMVRTGTCMTCQGCGESSGGCG